MEIFINMALILIGTFLFIVGFLSLRVLRKTPQKVKITYGKVVSYRVTGDNLITIEQRMVK